MSICNPAVFRTSLLTIAIFSLSACSTAPRMPDYDLSQIGDGIANAGRSTADFGRKALGKTAYLLGFTDEQPREKDDTLLEEVDVALLDSGRGEYTTPGSTLQRSTLQSDARGVEFDSMPIESDQKTGPASVNRNDAGIAGFTENTRPAEDLVYTVAVNENLWDISKSSTGDATNWHVIADVNNLGPNAAVYPGQKLVIPANLLRINDMDTAGKRLPLPEAADQTGDTPVPVMPVNATAFTLNANETLWDLARRTTGDATNWQAIAEANEFSQYDAAVVYPGQTIYVPDELVRAQVSELPEFTGQRPLTTNTPDEPVLPEAGTVDTRAAVEATPDNVNTLPLEGEPADTALQEVKSVPRIAAPEQQAAADLASTMISENGSSVEKAPLSTSALSLLDETQPLVIPPAAVESSENVRIVEASHQTQQATTSEPVEQIMPQATPTIEQTPREIMVSGTYYPKAVYNEADFSSSLLMRVSPGTRLQVSQAMGTWFEVQTDKGTGYVHQRDIK